MAFQIGVSLIYPAVLLGFYTKLLEILNNDLLANFSWANIKFTPRFDLD